MQETVNLEPNKFYHIYTRGNNKETLFRTKDNYFLFLQLYRKYLVPYVDTFAYCLLPNHVHFLIQVKAEEKLVLRNEFSGFEKQVNVQRQLAHLLNAYAKTINNQVGRTGRLFQQRFGRKEVSSDVYFTKLIHYIHFNPQHHSLIEDFTKWPYSSFHGLISTNNTNFQRDQVLDWFGGLEGFLVFHHSNSMNLDDIAPYIENDI